MKLQVAFDISDLDKALSIAQSVHEYADILEVGSLLIYKHGEASIKRFKEFFPKKAVLADAKIIDRPKDAVTLFAEAGADWITIMAGAGPNAIHTACTIAHSFNKKIMLDLTDSSSFGQSALEAKSLGADAILFHKPSTEDEHLLFQERWDMVKGNTTLPIYIAANINRENVADVLSIGATGIILGRAIVAAQDPKLEMEYFANLVGHKPL